VTGYVAWLATPALGTTLGGLLLMTGGLLLALVNRPAPSAATANTRSRGR